MNQEQKTARFDLPHVDEENKLCRVLSEALKSRLGNYSVSSESTSDRYWDAEHFGLQKVKMFQDASLQEQEEILRLCSCGLLEEAYSIEKAGVNYMAKMVLLAETTEEQMLYALFSSDEVTHLAQISSFLTGGRSVGKSSGTAPLPNREIVGTDDAFLRYLADLVESKDKTVLIFLLQVVLEGWGVSHYRSLARNCLNPQLASIFEKFLQDESRHHGTGIILFNQNQVSGASKTAIVEALALFLRMVQVGPQRVVAAVERVKGDVSREQKVRIFQELDTETHSGTRLNLLKGLMRSPEAQTIVQELEERGAFQPFPAYRCV